MKNTKTTKLIQLNAVQKTVGFRRKEFEMESERRKFATEKEITLARLEDEREKIKVCHKYNWYWASILPIFFMLKLCSI